MWHAVFALVFVLFLGGCVERITIPKHCSTLFQNRNADVAPRSCRVTEAFAVLVSAVTFCRGILGVVRESW